MAPNGRETLTALVRELRRDSDITGALYWDADSVPSSPGDRTRVYPGDPASTNDHPVEVAVQLSAAASSTSKSLETRAYIAECTAVAREEWYERYQSLRLWDIFDAVAALSMLGPAPDLVAEGMTSGSNGVEVEQQTGRRVLGGRWRYETTESRY